MKASYLVCYDIREEHRLARVYKLMKQMGIHVQYSVFHCRLTWNELVELKEKLKGIVDENEDDIRIYPLPQEYKVTIMGCGDRIPEGANIFLP